MAPRSIAERKADVLKMLETQPGEEKDAWVASASPSGKVHLVPLSYLWDGGSLVFATEESSRTARNLRQAERTRVALGSTRNVALIDGHVGFFSAEQHPDVATAFAATAGFDPRSLPGFVYIRLTPARIQAWRDVEESLTSREVMLDGRWLA